jgi:hemin uptake protein HemP
MTSEEPQGQPPDDAATGPLEPPPPTYTTQQLFRGSREVWIEHEGQRYRLRITTRGRLILTK